MYICCKPREQSRVVAHDTYGFYVINAYPYKDLFAFFLLIKKKHRCLIRIKRGNTTENVMCEMDLKKKLEYPL